MPHWSGHRRHTMLNRKIRRFPFHSDTSWFLILPESRSALYILIHSGLRDVAAGVYREHGMLLCGRSASTLKTASRWMDFPFVRCRAENNYQKLFATLLPKMRLRPTVPNVVVADLLHLSEDLRTFRFCRISRLLVQAVPTSGGNARVAQGSLGVSSMVQLCMSVSDCSKYCCTVLAWWAHNGRLFFCSYPLGVYHSTVRSWRYRLLWW